MQIQNSIQSKFNKLKFALKVPIATKNAGTQQPRTDIPHKTPLSNKQNWQYRVKTTSIKNGFAYHKRAPTCSTVIDESRFSQKTHLETHILKQQLEKKDKLLQGLIREIVENEETHKAELEKIDREYEEQIAELHDMLKAKVEQNSKQNQKEVHPSRALSSIRSSQSSFLLNDDSSPLL